MPLGAEDKSVFSATNEVCYAHPSVLHSACRVTATGNPRPSKWQDHTAPVSFGLEGCLKDACQLSRHFFKLNVWVNKSFFHQSREHIFLH
jgi:hypothetical protein